MCVVLKENSRPGGGSETYGQRRGAVGLSGSVPSAIGVSAVRTKVGNPARGVVAGARRRIREGSMTSFFGVGQFLITVSALLAAIFAICACLKTSLVGPSGALIFGCLALVILLPLLGTAVYVAVRDAGEDSVAADYARIVRGEESVWASRSVLDGQRTSVGMRALACISCLVFVGAIIACMCLDIERGAWHVSALLLAALTLFTVAAVVIEGAQHHSSVVSNDAEVYQVTVDVLAAPSGGQQQSTSGGVTLDGHQGATPGAFVSSVGLGSAVASGAGGLGRMTGAASHSA